jgi:hypothetical protein
MSFSGLLLLLGVLSVTALASAAVTLRLGVQHASEKLLAAVVLGHLFILAPVYVLGALSALTSINAALGTLAVSGLALVVVGHGRSMAQVLAEIGQAVRQFRFDLTRFMASAPGRAHLAGVLAVGMTGLIVWLTLTCYFAPSFRGYDAPWYHEPITAFAIQEHGLHVPAVPQRLFYVASLTRGSELMSAWLVLISGSRALIELPSIVGDLHACAMLTAAACFALARPVSRGALLALVAASLAVSMKLYALGPGAVLAGTALQRLLLAEGRTALRSPAAAILVLVAAGVALATPLRNAVVFGNPLYPVSVSVPFVGRALASPVVTTSRDLEMPPLGGNSCNWFFSRWPPTKQTLHTLWRSTYPSRWRRLSTTATRSPPSASGWPRWRSCSSLGIQCGPGQAARAEFSCAGPNSRRHGSHLQRLSC